MKAEAVKASYRRQIYENGEWVTLRRTVPLQRDYGQASDPSVHLQVVDYGLASEPASAIVDFGLVSQDAFDVAVMARIIPTFSPNDLVAAVQQVGRKAVICADDVVASTFPLPFRSKSDRVVLSDGRALVIDAVDSTTRRIAGVLIAYEMDLKGA